MRAAHMLENIIVLRHSIRGEPVFLLDFEQSVRKAGLLVETINVEIPAHLCEPTGPQSRFLIKCRLTDVVQLILIGFLAKIGLVHRGSGQLILITFGEPLVQPI